MIGMSLSMASNPSQVTVIQQAIAVLRKFGSDAHVYLPGASVPLLGAELLTNGGFATDINGWAGYSGAVAEWDAAQRLKVTIGGPAHGFQKNQTLALTVGARYNFNFDLSDGTYSGGFDVSIGGTILSTFVMQGVGRSVSFVAATANPAILVTRSAAATGTAFFDNISVREITGYTSMLNGLQAANYIDSAGTQQGAVDQPVGLALDAMGGLGVDVITNGDFSQWSGDNPVAWTLGALETATEYVTQVSGKARIVSAGPFFAIKQIDKLYAGKFYQVKIVINAVSAGGVSVFDSGTFTSQSFSAPGEYIFSFLATGTEIAIKRASAVATDVTVTSFSVREVTGIAASQPTTASKPILRRGAVNLLLTSTSLAQFTKGVGVSLAGNVVTGATDATWASANSVALSQTSLASSTAYTGAIKIRGITATTIALGLRDQTNGSYSKVAQSLTTNWTTVAISRTTGSGTTALGIVIGDADGSFEYESGGLFQGTLTAAQIQALGGIPVTTTAPASTALGSHFWQFDGSNDSLSLGGPLFQMADDHCVVAGLNPATTAAMAVFAPVYAGATSRYAYLIATGAGYILAEWYDGTQYVPLSTSYVAGTSYVVSAKKSGASLTARKNGVQFGSGAAFSTAVSGTTSSIGSSSSHPPMNGNIYPVIAIKGTVPDADLLLLERFVGQLSGISI